MNMSSPIFCKLEPAKQNQILFQCGGICFRSLQLENDISIIHEWVTQPYAHQFWQLNEPVEKIYQLYQSIMENPDGHSFIGLMKGVPVCQVDVYRIWADEVHHHIPDAKENDCGMHLLMAPVKQPISNLTDRVLISFLAFYFSFPVAEIMYGEPDSKNLKAISLIRRNGFQFLSEIAMSYKMASLHSITKQQFHETHPVA